MERLAHIIREKYIINSFKFLEQYLQSLEKRLSELSEKILCQEQEMNCQNSRFYALVSSSL